MVEYSEYSLTISNASFLVERGRFIEGTLKPDILRGSDNV